MEHPSAASRHPLKVAMPAARQSRFCGILGEGFDHPRRAARDPLKGVTLADRQSRIGCVLGWSISRWSAPDAQVGATSHASNLGCGHLTGMLRVEAVAFRRGVALNARSLS
jgi:hypothetical protein